MTPSQQRLKFDRLTRRLERKYEIQIRDVIINQIVGYSRAIRSNTLDAIYSIDKYFDESQMRNTYEDMIIECFETFKIDDPDTLIKAIDTGVWVTLMQQYITTVGGERITQINRFTKSYVLSKLRPILNNGIEDGLGIAEIATNIIRNIGEYTGKFARYRAERIARTEVIGSSNQAGLTSVKAAGIEDMVQKVWLPTNDDRTRDNHKDMANHRPIGLNEDFEVPRLDGGVDLMGYPGDPRGSAENTINCRCTVIYQRV